MKIHKFTSKNIVKVSDMVLALGFFDGVHIGHQKVINSAIEVAREKGLQSAVLTFSDSPKAVIYQKQQSNAFSTSDKGKIFSSMGLDHMVVLDFNKSDFQNISPIEFVRNFLLKLGAQIVVCGPDYRYGKNRSGKVEELAKYSDNQIEVIQESMVVQDGDKISSTILKEHLKNNKLDAASKILGRPYSFWGVVKHGSKEGRVLGFKTANLDIQDDFTIHLSGVFAVSVSHKGKTYKGVANVGTRPTFDSGDKKVVEVFLFEFDNEIYDQTIKIEFMKFIRAEKKFDSAQELAQQIKKDVEKVKKL